MNIVKSLALVVIGLFVLSIFGWMSMHLGKGDKDFGIMNKFVSYLSNFPDTFTASVEKVKTIESVDEMTTFALPETFVKTPKDFKPINKLDSNLYVLTSFSDEDNPRTVALMNLKNDEIVHEWKFTYPLEDHKRVFNPLLLPDKNLVYFYTGYDLIRVDSEGNKIWTQSSTWPHHSLNLDAHGDIWTCTYDTVYFGTGKMKFNKKDVYFKDENITKVDAETGEVLFNKSMADILAENNLSSYLLKSGNVWDPIHINDIQPALVTNKHYEMDDVFISSKHLSAILHYRPSTNELIDVIEGPFVAQHDVDFYDEHTLVFFNNNAYPCSNEDFREAPKDQSLVKNVGDIYSNIIKYDFRTKKFTTILEDQFKKNQIFTYTEGLMEFYAPNTCFVEEQNSGQLWIFKDEEVIYHNVFKSNHKGYHHLPNWTRIINKID